MNFLEDLLKLSNSNLKVNFNINFADEAGIDAGGLKREFYDMIGSTLKDERYKFFTKVPTNPNKYFFHPEAN